MLVDRYLENPFEEDRFPIYVDEFCTKNIMRTAASQSLSFLVKETTTCKGCAIKKVSYRQVNYLRLNVDPSVQSAEDLAEIITQNLEDHVELKDQQQCKLC